MPHTATAAAVPAASRTPRPAPRRARPKPVPEPVLARIERAGPAALEDHELLGLLGLDVDPDTLAASGGLRELLDDPDDLLHVVLLSPEHRARVHALHEVHARWMEARIERDGGPLTSTARTRRYVEARLRGYRNEIFACLFLDTRHRVIAFETLFRGTLDSASVHPRVVVRRALGHNAARSCACITTPRASPSRAATTASSPNASPKRSRSSTCALSTTSSSATERWSASPSAVSSEGAGPDARQPRVVAVRRSA